MKKQQSIYGEMKSELQRRQEVEREARERARQMRANSQDRIRESTEEKSVQQVIIFWPLKVQFLQWKRSFKKNRFNK